VNENLKQNRLGNESALKQPPKKKRTAPRCSTEVTIQVGVGATKLVEFLQEEN